MSDIHALSGAYAVDALDDLERARFERHLAECPDCQLEVASLQEAAGRLADTTATVPPSGLRERLLADIGQVRPLPPEVPTTSTAPHPHPGERRRPRWFPALVAAAVVAVLGLGAAIWQPWADETSQAPTLTAAERVLAADDAQRVTVELDDGARATVVRSVSERRAVLLTEDMPPPPDGKVYEVWLQSPESDMEPAGLMPADADRLLLEGDAAEATAAGITVEPAGGSPAPTTEPIVLFDFSEAT